MTSRPTQGDAIGNGTVLLGTVHWENPQVLEAGELLWRTSTVCEFTRMDADSVRGRVLDLVICDYTTPARETIGSSRPQKALLKLRKTRISRSKQLRKAVRLWFVCVF